MDDIAARYEPMMKGIAELYSGDPELSAYIGALRVNRDEWDHNMEGGHFWFEEMPNDANVEIIDALADDADGATICITLHLVGRQGNWAEWYRWPTASVASQPILRWPPPAVTLNHPGSL